MATYSYMQNPDISFVIPLYNEQENIALLAERLNKVMQASPLHFEVVLINDGSEDETPHLIHSLALEDTRYHCIFLARNYGHQIALTAGLRYARARKAVMVLDGDLQDPPELFQVFYAKFQEGYDVVYAVRKKRKEGWLKKLAYASFYRIFKNISYVQIPLDSGDFSLMSRRVVNVLNQMPEESRFIRGMRTWVGFNQIGIEYERMERRAGESKYSLKMLIRLAYNGIFNFSEIPIKFITRLGVLTTLLSLIYLFYTLLKRIFWNTVPEGFTALLMTIILFSGVQLISLGVIGEYVLRIFFQVKNRPLFIIKSRVLDGKEDYE